ncbi:glycosyltransferase family 2 protein [Chryseolinea sp. H1M3-3]|uniref:glycosyltransferase family 2 protein n=1 Tax=Chryseolinea sp. H1M3-3 TaxID=3034144 RepID=UPI0023EC8181|nr:glycosyltransferase family 2 protein [Chryseolinea sp. H1M3-3]
MVDKIGIATTIRGCDTDILNSFIKYHLFIGFDHFILFYDDENECVPTIFNETDHITVIKNNTENRANWQGTDSKYLLEFTQTDLIARQILNLELAIKMAPSLGVSWLVHIDVDELFLCLGWKNVKEHFQSLDKHNVKAINYVNYECIPERSNVTNYFLEGTLFKKNVKHLNENQKCEIESSKLGSIKNYFLFYENGKPAGKISDQLRVYSPHLFFNSVQARTQNFPIILHYPICGFKHFYAKYKVMGMFPDKWLGQYTINDYLPFHVKARDIVNLKDQSIALRFYQDEVIDRYCSLTSQLVKRKIFRRISLPSRILRKVLLSEASVSHIKDGYL